MGPATPASPPQRRAPNSMKRRSNPLAGADLRGDVLRAAYRSKGALRLSCSAAHELAHRLGVPLGRVGRICHEENIKIVRCQLGCF